MKCTRRFGMLMDYKTYDQLRILAFHKRKKMSMLVRDAIDEYLSCQPRAQDTGNNEIMEHGEDKDRT